MDQNQIVADYHRYLREADTFRRAFDLAERKGDAERMSEFAVGAHMAQSSADTLRPYVPDGEA